MANKGFWQSIWNSLKGIFSNGPGAYQEHLQQYYDEHPDSYLGWDNIKNIGESYINQYTQAGLTGREKAMMQYQTQERLDAQAFEERMSSTSYQRAVADMQNAGINPALMYGHGAGGASTPSSSGQTAPGYSPSSMSDLIQLLTLKPTLDKLKADTRAVEAESALTKQKTKTEEAETGLRELVRDMYPDLTNAQINDYIASADLKVKEGNVADATADLTWAKKEFQDKENINYEVRVALMKAQRDETLSRKELEDVQKWLTSVEAKYEQDTGMKMSSNQYLGLALAVGTLLGVSPDKIRSFFSGLWKK